MPEICASIQTHSKTRLTNQHIYWQHWTFKNRTFKNRFRNHTKSFRHQKYETETDLSKYIRELKKKNIDDEIRWEIMKLSNTYKRSRICNLCLDEKLEIITNRNSTLNSRRELITKCRHHSPRPPDRIKTPPLRAAQLKQPTLA